ncbi:MAG: 2Fe-2S iron-sulfur cluster-binding protein, partial [Rhodobacterales bacterium]
MALLRAVPKPTVEQVQGALGGVLCRCTGYRKIIDAVCEVGHPDVPFVVPLGSGAVGTSIRRLDGLRKVQGREMFGDDVAPAGALVIKAVRSPFPRAAFQFGDLDRFVTGTPGLRMVLKAADVPGKNAFGVIPAFQDQP